MKDNDNSIITATTATAAKAALSKSMSELGTVGSGARCMAWGVVMEVADDGCGNDGDCGGLIANDGVATRR